MRLFIAINFTDNIRSQLISLGNQLRYRSEHGNFSSPENLHLTLAFLGECNIHQTTSIKAAMDSISFPPVPITIECVGHFRSDLWWAGIKLAPQLSQLQKELTSALIQKGFILDSKKFHPHITLGREILTTDHPWDIEPFGETITAIDLMKSERISGKLTYTKIYSKSAEKII